MLADTNLPPEAWGEAVMTANYLRNRSPTSGQLQGALVSPRLLLCNTQNLQLRLLYTSCSASVWQLQGYMPDEPDNSTTHNVMYAHCLHNEPTNTNLKNKYSFGIRMAPTQCHSTALSHATVCLNNRKGSMIMEAAQPCSHTSVLPPMLQ
jgi:hypothetical protein